MADSNPNPVSRQTRLGLLTGPPAGHFPTARNSIPSWPRTIVHGTASSVCSRAALESLLHESFTEIGATGRHYTRDTILPILLAPQPFPPRQISDFHARPITDTVALTTYTLTRTDLDGSEHQSRRSSLWLLDHTTWRLTFHQATNLPDPPPSPTGEVARRSRDGGGCSSKPPPTG